MTHLDIPPVPKPAAPDNAIAAAFEFALARLWDGNGYEPNAHHDDRGRDKYICIILDAGAEAGHLTKEQSSAAQEVVIAALAGVATFGAFMGLPLCVEQQAGRWEWLRQAILAYKRPDLLTEADHGQ